MTELRFAHAINRALTDSMEADENVVTFGEDVAKPGGPFGVTKGLLDKFGSSRVRDTPISEAAITGTAVGAAMSGLKPVVEIMFIDFITLAMDALVNQAFRSFCDAPSGGRAAALPSSVPHSSKANAAKFLRLAHAWHAFDRTRAQCA